jgi:hypothetical protein
MFRHFFAPSPALRHNDYAGKSHDPNSKSTFPNGTVAQVALVIPLMLPACQPFMRSVFCVSDDDRLLAYRIAALAQAWSEGVLYADLSGISRLVRPGGDPVMPCGAVV